MCCDTGSLLIVLINVVYLIEVKNLLRTSCLISAERDHGLVHDLRSVETLRMAKLVIWKAGSSLIRKILLKLISELTAHLHFGIE